MPAMATTAEVRDLLATTSLPPDLVDELLEQASAAWLVGEPATALAADLALCHPPLAGEEVRAVVHPTAAPATWRVCVVAHDRPGLLAGAAGALATRGLSIISASGSLWPGRGLALVSLTARVADGSDVATADWDEIGERLRAVIGRRERIEPDEVGFRPMPPVKVDATAEEHGRAIVTIETPDRVGLLWAAARWFEERDCNIEAVTIATDGALARDTFVVVGDAGEVDTVGLAALLGGGPAAPDNLPSALLRIGVQATLAASAVAAGLALRALRAGRSGQ